jgi:hypothetical protein
VISDDSQATAATHQAIAPRRALLPALCVATLLAAVAALSFLSGGYILQRTAPVVFVLAVLAVVAVWRVRSPARPSRPYLVAAAAFGAFVAWTGLSVLWSIGPDLSWVAFDVAALYLVVLVAAGLLPGRPLQLRLAAHGFALVVLVVAGYAFLGKIAPDVVRHAHLFARLSAPVGYWNVLAAMIAMAMPMFLVTASRPQVARWLRGLAACALVLLLFTLFFTFSRGGSVAFAAALLVFFALASRRLSAFVSLVIPVLLVAAVLYRLRHLGTLFNATTDDALRTAQGHTLAAWFVAALGLAFVAQVVAALIEHRLPLSARGARLWGTAVIAVLVLAPLVAGGVYLPRHGGVAHWFTSSYHAALSSSGAPNAAQRLTSLGSSGRLPWWGEAVRGFAHHPVTGTGAGTFRFTNELYRTNTYVVKHSHSQWLNVLSELGIVGLVLFVIAIGGLVVAAFGRLRADRGDPHRSLLAACQAAMVVFIVHMSLDWDWDMAAITIAFLLLAGVSASYVRDRGLIAAGAPAVAARPAGASLLGLRLLATAILVFVVESWAMPYLAERATVAAGDLASRGRTAAALVQARRATQFDPLSVDPLLALAAVQAQMGQLNEAAATLVDAVRLQPGNYEPYYRMGTLQRDSFHDAAAARLWYEKALLLNPRDPATRHMLSLL